MSQTEEFISEVQSELEESSISLRELLRNKILSATAQNKDAQPLYLANFWWERNFTLGDGGQALCDFIKENFFASKEERESVKWQEKIDGPTEDLKKFEKVLLAKLGIKKFSDLNRGYLIAIVDIAKNQLIEELNDRIGHLRGQIDLLNQIGESEDSFGVKKDHKKRKAKKKVKGLVKIIITGKKDKSETQIKTQSPNKHLKRLETELSLKEKQLAKIDKRMNDIRITLLGFVPEVESEEEKSSVKESDETSVIESAHEESNHTEEEEQPKFSKDDFDYAQNILYALGKGGEVDINALKDTYYEKIDEDTFNTAFERFMLEKKKDLENSYIFLEGNEKIQKATVDLVDYLLKLQKDESARADKKNRPFEQKSAENKIEGLVHLIQTITSAENLPEISNALKGALIGRGDLSLQWNRGPFGKYWVGSMFKGLKNPVDKKWINSTTEQKVAHLYNTVFDREVELANAYENLSGQSITNT